MYGKIIPKCQLHRCENEAVTTCKHPVYGDCPVCDACAENSHSWWCVTNKFDEKRISGYVEAHDDLTLDPNGAVWTFNGAEWERTYIVECHTCDKLAQYQPDGTSCCDSVGLQMIDDSEGGRP